jgi:hypothetical protein
MERDQKLKEQEQKTIVKPPVEIFQEEKQTQPENHPPKPEQPKNLILSGREALGNHILFSFFLKSQKIVANPAAIRDRVNNLFTLRNFSVHPSGPRIR